MNELGWKPLNERRKEQRLVLLFKIVNDLVADNNIEYNQRPSRTSNSKQIKVLSATTLPWKPIMSNKLQMWLLVGSCQTNSPKTLEE
jgi:hypothetical protein